MSRRRTPDLLIIALLFALPLVMFWPQTLGGRTLLPTENLFKDEPFATYREVARAPAVPHNALLDDLVLENFQWKSFIRQSLAQGEIPLWDPHQFAGIPFLASGQQSTFYPLSIVYYIMPLTAAYGWFTVLNLWLAGVFMYLFARGLRIGYAGSALSGVVYQLSAFMVISAVFPMIIAAAVWLPLLLLMAEFIIRQQPLFGRPSSLPWAVVGAVALGCNILAGHVEMTYYTLIILAYYAATRLFVTLWRNMRTVGTRQAVSPLVQRGLWLAVMVALGIGLGAVQFVPLVELVQTNWRSGSASLEQVRGWAHPLRDLVQFAMPNFYGNPSHHSYFDVFSSQTVTQFTDATAKPITMIDWGIKNYVEGALYLGILPLSLAVYTLIEAWSHWRTSRVKRDQTEAATPSYRAIFALLGLLSLTFMFGAPTYALLYYGFPGLNQSHTPFRWIYALTLSIAVLAGFGLDTLAKASPDQRIARRTRRLSLALLLAGIGILAALLLSRIFYPQIEPLVDRVFRSLANAPNAFSDARMFYSYEFTNMLMFALFVLGSGVMLWWASQSKVVWAQRAAPLQTHTLEVWQVFAVGLVAVDLMVASWGFNPASDPALLDFTPPAIQWLQQQPGDWRYTTLDDPTLSTRLMNPNVGWRYGLDDIRGYESIIPKQYVDYMNALAPQGLLDNNRIAPLYTSDELNYFGGYHRTLDSPLLDLLNVRYVMTHKTTTIYFQEWKLVYEDEAVRIWENDSLVPRAYTLPQDDPTLSPDLSALSVPVKPKRVPSNFEPAAITQDTGREKWMDVEIAKPRWLVVSESYFSGWRAFIRPQGAGDDAETPLDVKLVQGNFQGIFLPEAGKWTVRLVYSPASFQIGLFGTFISGVLVIFMSGVYVWRLFIAPDESGSRVAVVARNSLAPIILNLFNRGIDFAFAFVMLRILGPADAGIYFYAAFIFGWFDIFTNFGLNVFLTREVARDHSKAWTYLYNTSILRLILMVAGVFLLAGFLAARQSLPGSAPLASQAIVAIGLLYIGLLPNSLSTGLSALFYAFQKAEYPAAIATIATISKAVFGVAALALGYGVVGLAAVSIVTNCITLAVMVYTSRRLIRRGDLLGRPYRPDARLMRGMVDEGWPLMLNHFLASIFFQVDVVIIQAVHGDRMVGQYGVAYKWLSALNVIPAFFTMALLPVMSRQAHEDRAAFKRNYRLAIKLLMGLALPVAVLFTFLAYTLTGILGGAEYLPDGAIATQLMIWSIPIGWMNSLTQYVLIALDLQRRITRAFVIAVSFNIISNLILIPPYGYRAAALTTIASELTLFVAFVYLLTAALGRIGWLTILWRPLVATGVMLALMAALWPVQPLAALIAGCIAYPAALLALRPLTPDELAILAPLIPVRLRRTALLARIQSR